MHERHVLVTGDSGTGKTTKTRDYHANCPSMSVVVNHSDEPGFAGETATSAKGMVRATKRFEDVADVRINLRDVGPVEGITMAKKYARDMFDTFKGVSTFNGVQIVVPEGHKALPDDSTGPDDHPGKWIAHRGRGEGIKLVVESQTPTKFDYDSLIQIPYWVWVGPPAGFADGFLQAHSWIPEENLPEERYHFVTMDKRGNILFKGKTTEDYGVAMG